ncbi:MAG: class II aldolase/adducin family protein [Pseudomonadota bacterium]
MMHTQLLTDEFRALSARLGQDPLQVQGAGGNTSIKSDGVMWIKASGTELAQAERQNIFVAVDRQAARAEALELSGDGSCKATVLDDSVDLRPSIETTFHAVLDWRVVAHTHSVATLVHAISPEGRIEALHKLSHLHPVLVPYAKPGLPLTREIRTRLQKNTQVIILQNHGLVCCGDTVAETDDLIREVEERLYLDPCQINTTPAATAALDGFAWSEHNWLAKDKRAIALATAGTYYPDHVVFLGPGLPEENRKAGRPVVLRPGEGVMIRKAASTSQKAMLRCLSDVFSRLPKDWSAEPIGAEAEAELLNWDAEKYRQSLAAQT